MLALLLALVALPPGEIFGDLRLGDSYVPDAAIRLTCGTDTSDATTDKSGSYRLRSKSNGKCNLTVTYKGQSSAVDVVVFEKPTRYRLVLELADGKYTLKRV